jgi:DNA end-binding protein Ku
MSPSTNVVNLMDALRKSLTTEGKAPPSPSKTKKSKKAAAGQREMLMAIPGKGEGKKSAAKDPKRSRAARERKVG